MSMNGSGEAPALELKGIVAGYGSTTILRGIDLSVPKSSVVALLGANGAGKSTLLKTASGLIKPTAGTIHVNGEDMTHEAPHKLAHKGLCHIPEGHGIFRSLTVKENLIMQAPVGKEAESIERACQAFPILGERLTQLAGSLSGGQQQMLAMARAYVRDPNLILVDEASLGLAPIIVDAIFAFLHDLTKQGAALLIVDQFVARALDMASYAYVMHRGELVFQGLPADLLAGDVFERYMGSAATH